MKTDNTKQSPTTGEVELSEEKLEGINGGAMGPVGSPFGGRRFPRKPRNPEEPKEGGAPGSW